MSLFFVKRILAFILSLLSFPILTIIAAPDSSLVIPLSMEFYKNIPKEPIISVSIGGGPQASLSFDTGSVGIFIKESFVGKHIKTDKEVLRDYGSGTRERKYKGRIVISTLQIIKKDVSGNKIIAAETYPIPMVVVPDEAYKDAKHDGIFGVRLSNEKYGIISPLAALTDRTLGSGFIVDVNPYSQSTLTLGINKDNISGFKFTDNFPKQHSHRSISAKVPKDINFWHTSGLHTKSTIYIPQNNGNPEKVYINTDHTIFDTGSNRIHYCLNDNKRKSLDSLIYEGELLKQNTVLELGVSNVFDWKIEPSIKKHNSHNVYFLDEKKHHSYLNTGISIFFDYRILYDIQKGRIGFLKKK